MKNDDLLNIGNNDNKKNLRKILIYAAVGFLIFVIAIIAVALYQNKSSKEENAILPPQVNEQNQELFKQVPIETENNITQNQNTAKKQEKVNSQKIIQLQKQNQMLNQKSNKKVSALPNQSKTKTQNLSRNNIAKNQNISQSKKSKLKSVQKYEKIIQNKKVFNKSRYYIQVAALLKYSKPNKNFLKLIMEYGYKYTFYTTYIKRGTEKIKVTKILIGPFKNKNSSTKNLS